MKRALVLLAVIAIAAAATPWAIGWRAEQLVRARVAQLDADHAANVRLRIDSYQRGWRGATAQFNVVDRQGAPLVTLKAAIRHWPFASGGPADWIAVPELGSTVQESLGAWGAKLPELTVRSRLSWGGDLLTRIESTEFKRRVPELMGGSIEVAAIAGTVDWRRNGALTYELALPEFRIEQQARGGGGAADAVEFKAALLKGEGSLGTAERRWNQKGSLSAASVSVTAAGAKVFTAATPFLTYASRDEGEHVNMQFAFTLASVSARHALSNLSEAQIEFAFEARHLAREPLGRLLDAREEAAARQGPGATPGRASASRSHLEETSDDLLRGSPAADVNFKLKAQEGRVELKLVVAFDGLGMESSASGENLMRRTDAELNARATTSLVIVATRVGTEAVVGMFTPPRRKGDAIEMPEAPPLDPNAGARAQLNALAAQGLIRFEGDEVATTVRWREGQLTINGQDMNALRDLARGFAGR